MRSLPPFGIALLASLAAAPAIASEAARPFSANHDPATSDRALQCLTEAIYYEARSESEDGQRAVAQVVLNRVRHPAFPNSVCGVVHQGSRRATGCQFTFTCDGSLNTPVEPYAWDRAQRIAAAALGGAVYRPVGLATNYHTTAIRPYWAPSLVPQVTLGAHVFYRRPGSGTVDAFSQAPAENEPAATAQTRYAVARAEAWQGERRIRYETPVLEIPVPERPVRFRTLGGRRSAAPPEARSPQRTAAAAPARRLTVQGGIRVFRGGAARAAN